MDFNKIISDLKNKVYHPVYFLMGEEPYFIDAISDQVEKGVLDEMEKEFNQTILYGRDVDSAAIVAAAKRFPMMANHQVVIVKEAQSVRDLVGREKAGEEGEAKSSKSKSAFAAYLENPLKSTILVICYKYKTIDKRTSLAKVLAKNAVLFESKKLYDNQVPDWIIAYLKQRKYTVSPKAAMLLTEYLGNDLGRITNELDKLMITIPAGSEITAEHVQQNIGISKDYNTFELQNALGTKNVLKANRIVNYFGANPKDNPLVLTIVNLYGYFSKLLVYHSLADKSKNTAAAAMGVHPFFVGDYERAARNYSTGKLKAIFGWLREYDLKSKGFDNASVTEGELLKELVFKILH